MDLIQGGTWLPISVFLKEDHFNNEDDLWERIEHGENAKYLLTKTLPNKYNPHDPPAYDLVQHCSSFHRSDDDYNVEFWGFGICYIGFDEKEIHPPTHPGNSFFLPLERTFIYVKNWPPKTYLLNVVLG